MLAQLFVNPFIASNVSSLPLSTLRSSSANWFLRIILHSYHNPVSLTHSILFFTLIFMSYFIFSPPLVLLLYKFIRWIFHLTKICNIYTRILRESFGLCVTFLLSFNFSAPITASWFLSPLSPVMTGDPFEGWEIHRAFDAFRFSVFCWVITLSRNRTSKSPLIHVYQSMHYDHNGKIFVGWNHLVHFILQCLR